MKECLWMAGMGGWMDVVVVVTLSLPFFVLTDMDRDRLIFFFLKKTVSWMENLIANSNQ